MTDPLCAVVIPSFNHRRFIGAAIDSVLAQSCGAVELIVIDDGSSDGSADHVRARYGEAVHRLEARANRGAHAAINDGIAAARAPFVAILNSDDVFAPTRLERMLAAMQRHGADVVFSDLAFIDETGAALPDDCFSHAARSQAAHAEDWRGALVEVNLALTTSNLVIRKAALAAIGPFRPFRYVHDWDFLLRALSRGTVAWVRERLCSYRLHGANTIREAAARAGGDRLAAEQAAMAALFLHEAAGTPMAARRARVLRSPDLRLALAVAIGAEIDRAGAAAVLDALDRGAIADAVRPLAQGPAAEALRDVTGAMIREGAIAGRLVAPEPARPADAARPRARPSMIGALRFYLRARRAYAKHVRGMDVVAFGYADARLKEAAHILGMAAPGPAPAPPRRPGVPAQPVRARRGNAARAVMVSHVGYAGGASLILLSLARRLRRDFGIEVASVIAGPGELVDAFAALGPTVVWPGTAPLDGAAAPDPAVLARRLSALLDGSERTVAFCNTVVTAPYARALKTLGVPVIGLIHEHAASYAERLFTDMFAGAERVVFPAQLVRDAAAGARGFDAGRVTVLPQDLVFDGFGAMDPQEARRMVRDALAIPAEAPLVLGCGIADLRKGFDLFVATLVAAAESVRRHGAYFVWLGSQGGVVPAHRAWLARDLAAAGLGERLVLAPAVAVPEPYYHAADVFLLPSREDPFPCVAQEAMACRLPVICFRDATGATELVDAGAGSAVPFADAGAMAQALARLLDDAAARRQLGEQARALALDRFGRGAYAAALHAMMTELLAPAPPASVAADAASRRG